MPFYPHPTLNTPWIQPYWDSQPHIPLLGQETPPYPTLPPPPPSLHHHNQIELEEQDVNFQAELDASIIYNRETRPIHACLDGIKVFVMKEGFERKIFIRCRQNLIETSFHLRPTNPLAGKYTMLFLPTLRIRPVESSINQNALQLSHMNFIIWNCKGSQSVEFHRNFRSLLNYNRPTLVVILETHCQSHQLLKDDSSSQV